MKQRGFVEVLQEKLAEMAPSVKGAVAEIGAELKQMGSHGAHELAAALFNGSGFVMYPRGTRDDHGVHGHEAGREEAAARESVEQERGGREM